MDAYRRAAGPDQCTYGCPIGSLALELHEPDQSCASASRKNFTNWTAAIEECLDAAGNRAAGRRRQRALSEFVLTTMGRRRDVWLGYRDIGCFDRAIGELRVISTRLLRPAKSCRPAAGHNGARRGRIMP